MSEEKIEVEEGKKKGLNLRQYAPIIEKFQKLSPETREKLGLKSLKDVFLTETNAENRMKIVKVNGIKAIYDACGATSVEVGAGEEDGYELITLNMGDNRHRPYLKMVNPSTQEIHIEGVHPDCKTIKAALEWRNKTPDKPVELT
jgi:hypothetical protein